MTAVKNLLFYGLPWYSQRQHQPNALINYLLLLIIDKANAT